MLRRAGENPSDNGTQVGVANTRVRRHRDFSPNESPAIADLSEQLVGRRGVPVIFLRDLSIRRPDDLRIHGMTGETVVRLPRNFESAVFILCHGVTSRLKGSREENRDGSAY